MTPPSLRLVGLLSPDVLHSYDHLLPPTFFSPASFIYKASYGVMLTLVKWFETPAACLVCHCFVSTFSRIHLEYITRLLSSNTGNYPVQLEGCLPPQGCAILLQSLQIYICFVLSWICRVTCSKRYRDAVLEENIRRRT
jgi:hypothetical protein